MIKNLIYILLVLCPFSLFAQSAEVPFASVPTNQEIINALEVSYSPKLQAIQEKYNNGQQEEALYELTRYFKERFSERYFFDWKNFEQRFGEYNKIYSGREDFHRREAYRHLDLYPATTQWEIGFTNLKGETVTSYPYRHLTRQHKADDIAFMYHYTGDKKYLDYIPEQAASLNAAFNNNLVETIEDGNGAYEVYRVGNRVYNWLMVHQLLLASDEYSVEQQMEMIRTFLHSAAKMYHHNAQYREGNHQTRGMSALAMLSILFPEIQGADMWQQRSLARLEEHLEKEIYPDGFQFERSVHYHIADIVNYFYPYQLAKICGVELNPIWDERITGLFDVLLKIAMPNGKAPVLQDDTREPWADFNKIDNTMAKGALLFGKPSYKYFASSKVASNDYWFFKTEQLENLKEIKAVAPQIGSCVLPETGYYMMRNGWGEDDVFMIMSAGFTPEKPAHQHADMLGLGAYAFGNMILPNYQVRYYLEDFPTFKNSWVKNVALLDSIPQGREWKGNKGGSGFGEWLGIPRPEVLAWHNTEEFDFFAGSHMGYANENTKYYRSVLFIKDGFWIVNDHFIGEGQHSAQQVWQGHYDVEKKNVHARSVFPNSAGLEVIQLAGDVDNIQKATARSKGRVVFNKKFQNETRFTTLLYPFKNFEVRLMIDDYNNFKADNWKVLSNQNSPVKTDAAQIIFKNKNYLFLAVSNIKLGDKNISLSDTTDLWVELRKEKTVVTNTGIRGVEINSKKVLPGESIEL